MGVTSVSTFSAGGGDIALFDERGWAREEEVDREEDDDVEDVVGEDFEKKRALVNSSEEEFVTLPSAEMHQKKNPYLKAYHQRIFYV